jgi:type II secretory pathway pseudopilin PulG
MVELIVVIAVMALLANILFTQVGGLVPKTRDSRRKSDVTSITIALNNFYAQKNRMPLNYSCGGAYCPAGGGDSLACENSPPGAWEASMTELVNAGYLTQIPRDPGPFNVYCYLDYGPTDPNGAGALVVSRLEAVTSHDGLESSCRPFASGSGRCDKTMNYDYCMCNTY